MRVFSSFKREMKLDSIFSQDQRFDFEKIDPKIAPNQKNFLGKIIFDPEIGCRTEAEAELESSSNENCYVGFSAEKNPKWLQVKFNTLYVRIDRL